MTVAAYGTKEISMPFSVPDGYYPVSVLRATAGGLTVVDWNMLPNNRLIIIRAYNPWDIAAPNVDYKARILLAPLP